MEKKFVYSNPKAVGDVFWDREAKETRIELNLGFAGRQTLFASSETITVNGNEVQTLSLKKIIHNNGAISTIRVGSLFKNVAKTGKEYYVGSFGLYCIYDKEKEKSLVSKDDLGITLQLFKLDKEKCKEIKAGSIFKVGFVNMQLYIAESNTENEANVSNLSEMSNMTDAKFGETIKMEEIPF